jgi:hypothetical protein
VVVTHIALIWLPAKALVIEIHGGPDQQRSCVANRLPDAWWDGKPWR